LEKLHEGGILIAKIHQLSGRIFQKKLKHHNLDDINPAQGRILFVLKQEDNITIQELSKRTSLGKSTLTSMLDRLVEQQFLTRVADKEDRRKILIKLSPKIKSIEKVYNTVSKEMINLFYKDFSFLEIIRFENDLHKILENLQIAGDTNKGDTDDSR
jgi:DNA-binding MarR family transcriptional regulator